MNITACSTRRAAFGIGAAALLAMVALSVAHNTAEMQAVELANSHHLANSGGMPLAPGPNGGEITRGNESGSFAPTSTNDLITPWTPTPGSPWRD